MTVFRISPSIYVVILWTCYSVLGQKSYSNNSSENLKLSPFIREGKIQDGVQLALVQNLKDFGLPTEVKSYSGFITVDERCGSHLFFWFFPAVYESHSAPVILWQGGGPGSSGLNGLFREHGPFFVDEFGVLRQREWAWTLTRSVIYVDSPVAAGFSEHLDRNECYVRSTSQTAKNMLQFTLQFFQLFPDLRKNELYLASGSYGAIALEIHNFNKRNKDSQINLQGMIMGSSYMDPLSQATDYSDFYFSYGLIDDKQREAFRQVEKEGQFHIERGNWSAAFEAIEPLVIGMDGNPSELKRITGIPNTFNMLQVNPPQAIPPYVPFLNRPDILSALHVSRRKEYFKSNPVIYDNFKEDMYQSVKELLNSGLYRFLIVSTQMDLIVPHTTITKYLHSVLKWKGRVQFTSAGRTQFSSDDQGGMVTGYVKTGGNVTHLYLLRAGHLWVHDQPRSAFKAMTLFTQGSSLVVDVSQRGGNDEPKDSHGSGGSGVQVNTCNLACMR